jgi:hypothetical protein
MWRFGLLVKIVSGLSLILLALPIWLCVNFLEKGSKTQPQKAFIQHLIKSNVLIGGNIYGSENDKNPRDTH